MFSVIIKRRTLTLILAGTCGVLLLLAGLKWGLFEQKNPGRDMPVELPAVSDVNIEDVTPQPFLAAETEGPDSNGPDKSSDFFVEYRLERERTRGQGIEWLREVINNDKSALEIRQKAQERLLAISSKMEIETELESMLKAKGFRDAAVITDERVVTVIVTADRLTASESGEINSLVSLKTGVDAQNIVIISKI